MRKTSSRVLPALLCLICVLAFLPVPAHAAGAIDVDRDVRLTIEYRHGVSPVPGLVFDLYHVADVDAYGVFTLAGDFQRYPVLVNGLSTDAWRLLAETLAVYAERDRLMPLDGGITDADGRLSFPNRQPRLKAGLYLAVGQKLVTSGYTYTTEPFLVALPNPDMGTGIWMYDVLAAPKHTKTENPPVPSGQTVERRILKIWKDDIPQLRPKEVVIQLLGDGVVYDTVTLSAANNWRHAWERLPAHGADGSRIVWSVAEKEAEGYTVLVARDGVTFTVTNTSAPEKPVTRTVVKIWDDRGYEDRRPGAVRVTLLQNGAAYDTVTLSAANGWQYTWENLPQYDNYGEITWTLREAAVSGYVSGVRQNGHTFVLTNTPERQKLPQTGVLWWPVPVLAAAGLALLVAGRLSGKKKDE